jgi:deoxyribonuclease I
MIKNSPASTVYFYHTQNKTYYDADLDSKVLKRYYCHVSFTPDCLHTLLSETHTAQLKYSPHEYVYPWVDLQENLQLKSLYSGQQMDPVEVMEQDIRLYEAVAAGELAAEKILFNTEHVVPQSWFNEDEPMRGDLHHLFACEPGCNSMRSNYPYYDFPSYEPEYQAKAIRDGCGMAQEGKFEPEYGKGIVARAVFYFAIRYRSVMKIEEMIDLKLLLRWHNEYHVSNYEKHRNAAIQELQGNRNPFIDFPAYAERMLGL